MTREELIEAVQRSADDHPRQARRALHRAQAERAIEVVLAEVLRCAYPALEREWAGTAVLERLYALRGRR
jgi:ABC-type nitrate/sulfonate/bicarbonate transport system substrate-binding protein